METRSPLCDLLPDLKNDILSFLNLSECLCYSRVSLFSLQEVLPNLTRRRKREFCERRVYRKAAPLTLYTCSEANLHGPAWESDTACLLQSDEEEEEIDNEDIFSSSPRWYVIPSVKERIRALYKALPLGYYQRDSVRKLLMDLENENFDSQQDDSSSFPDGVDRSEHFNSLLVKLKDISKAHRLHSHLIDRCTTECQPQILSANSLPTITLDNYLGDVLVATYLVGHAIAEIVDGPQPYRRRMEDGHIVIGNRNYEQYLENYRQWVFLHSSILRRKPMERENLVQCKLPAYGIVSQVEGGPQTDGISETSYIFPHNCFCTAKNYSNTLFINGKAMRTRWNDFGPLGPSFRGRDNVQFITMDFHSVFLIFKNCGKIRHMTRELWLQLESFCNWLFVLPRECYKNRPMTVEPPQITWD